ncbi:hypothetical protein ACWGCW_31155 [Streptomyces sp. NPDC054933]
MAQDLQLFTDPDMNGNERDLKARPGDQQLKPAFHVESVRNTSDLAAELYPSPAADGPPIEVIQPHDDIPATQPMDIRSVRFVKP